MLHRSLAAGLTLLALAMPAMAQPPQKPKSFDRQAGEIATQPLSDTNLKKREIAPVLEQAVIDPYAGDDTRSCKALVAAIAELDAALGEDFDAPPLPPATRDQKREEGAGAVGKAVVNGLIPFRGLVRYVSGAEKADRAYNLAVDAGLTRRGFLKGIGRQKGCKPPAAPQRKPAE